MTVYRAVALVSPRHWSCEKLLCTLLSKSMLFEEAVECRNLVEDDVVEDSPLGQEEFEVVECLHPVQEDIEGCQDFEQSEGIRRGNQTH